MAIFTRRAITDILNSDADVSEKLEQIMSLQGRALETGYILKSTAEAEKADAIADALAKNKPEPQQIDVTTTAEYKAIVDERDMLRALGGEDFAGVKPKFRETVYKQLERGEGAKPVSEQLTAIKASFEEYFEADKTPPAQNPTAPQFGAPVTGSMPQGKDNAFEKIWFSGREKA